MTVVAKTCQSLNERCYAIRLFLQVSDSSQKSMICKTIFFATESIFWQLFVQAIMLFDNFFQGLATPYLCISYCTFYFVIQGRVRKHSVGVVNVLDSKFALPSQRYNLSVSVVWFIIIFLLWFLFYLHLFRSLSFSMLANSSVTQKNPFTNTQVKDFRSISFTMCNILNKNGSKEWKQQGYTFNHFQA